MKKTRRKPSAREQPFWQTVPGLITAVAALLTAIGGCVALFTTNPRLLDLVLKPSITPSPTAQITAGSPAASTSTISGTAASTLSPRPVQLPDGQSVTFIDTTGNTHQYTILSAKLDSLPPGLMLLDLRIRVSTNYGINFWNDSFRLSAGGQQLKPTNFTDVYVSANTTADSDIQFQVDLSVKEATLTIILPIDMPNNTKQLQLLFP